MELMLADGNNLLVPTAWEAVVTVLGFLYMAVSFALFIFAIVVLLTWVRKNKLRIIELEFEEQAIDRRRAQGEQQAQ